VNEPDVVEEAPREQLTPVAKAKPAPYGIGRNVNVRRLAERARAREAATCTGCGLIHEPTTWELINVATGNTVEATDDYEQVLGWELEPDSDLVLVEFDSSGLALDDYAPPPQAGMNRAERRAMVRQFGRRGPQGKLSGKAVRDMRRSIAAALVPRDANDIEGEGEVVISADQSRGPTT
jgi:hypothetical protein